MVLELIAVLIVNSVFWTPQHAVQEQVVIRSQPQLARLWKKDGGAKKDCPKINFRTQTVLAVFAGEKPVDGIRIRIEHVLRPSDEKSGALKVVYREFAPDPDAVLLPVLTYPADVVVIPKWKGEVQFISGETPEGRAILDALGVAPVGTDPNCGCTPVRSVAPKAAARTVTGEQF